MKTTKNKCNCEIQKPLDMEFSSLEAIIEGNVIKLSYDAYSCDSSFSTEIYINYCPICGRKLVN